MIRKDVVKYWVSAKELLEKFGFDQDKHDLLMDVKVYKNPNNPLGYQIQGVDLSVEQSTEIKNELRVPVEDAGKTTGK